MIEAEIEYRNLKFPEVNMKKRISIAHADQLEDVFNRMKAEVIQYEAYQKGLRDGANKRKDGLTEH